MENAVHFIPTRPDTSADPSAGPQQALRCTVHDLRLEVERRAWARRPVRGALDALVTPLTLPPDRASREAASDPLIGLLAQLQAALTRYVYELRAEGARPEQMLVQVKTFVRDTMGADGWRDPEAARELTELAVRWSIDAYYGH